MQWCLLICLTRDACLFSPYLNWALLLLLVSSNSGLSFCNRVRGCLCSEAYTKKNYIPFLWTAGGRKVVHYSTECNPLHYSTEYLFFYPPSGILVCRIPGEENALSHSLYLLVLDWCWCVRAGQRMEDGKLIIGEWVSGESWYPQLLFTLWARRIHQAETRCHLRIQLLTT